MLTMRPALLRAPPFGSEKPLFQQQVKVSRHSRNRDGKLHPDRQHPSLKRVLKQTLIYSLALRLRRVTCHKKALSLIHISEPTRLSLVSRMPSSA